MSRIIAHIEHLLITHDCVVVPGIGAILAGTVGARIDRAAGKVVPPHRVFTFNPAINHNDGVLAASVARREGISYEAACRIVENASDAMSRELESTDKLSLGRVGSIVRASDGSLCFITSGCRVLSPAAMWLPEVNTAAFSAISDAAGATVAARSAMRPRAILYKVARMAAAMALLIAVGLALTTPVKVDDYRQASLGISAVRAEAPHRELIETPGHATAPVVLVLRTHSDAATVVDTAAIARRHAIGNPGNTARYCLVVASLASEAETLRYLKETNDNSLGYFKKDGRYRVYAVQGGSIDEVKSAAEAAGISSRYSQSWICRK